MKPFTFIRPANSEAAIKEVSGQLDAAFLGGGTNLIDLMKEGVAGPSRLVDINRLPLAQVEEHEGGVRIGALARNSDVANHKLIRERYPLLSQALLAGASPQLRNLATVGGNLLQRTRCYYFYDVEMPCNKRLPGSGCGALEGFNRIHAILGTSDQCIAAHPSDMCVAMAALDAVVQVTGPAGKRAIPFTEFHRLPGETPDRDTNLNHGELITSVDLPAAPFVTTAHYLKIRDRASYAFALVSVAAGVALEGKKIKAARIALGGVSHKPWRSEEAEAALAGMESNEESFKKAADIALRNAKAFKHNGFKIEMARRAIVRALGIATASGSEIA